MMNDQETELRHRFRHAESGLEQQQLERLRASRELALRHVRLRRWPRLLMPVAGMAVASALAVVMVLLPATRVPDSPGQADYLSADSAEFYQELDFYYWLSRQDKRHRS